MRNPTMVGEAPERIDGFAEDTNVARNSSGLGRIARRAVVDASGHGSASS